MRVHQSSFLLLTVYAFFILSVLLIFSSCSELKESVDAKDSVYSCISSLKNRTGKCYEFSEFDFNLNEAEKFCQNYLASELIAKKCPERDLYFARCDCFLYRKNFSWYYDLRQFSENEAREDCEATQELDSQSKFNVL